MLGVITIVKDDFDALTKTFFSLQRQRDNNFYWILVNGSIGSNSIKSFLSKQTIPFKHSIINESDLGIYNAMNKGVKVSQSISEISYIWFLNAGDLAYDDSVTKKISANIGNEHSSLIFYSFKLDSEHVIKPTLKKLNRESFLYGTPHCHQATLFNKSCFQDKQFNESYKIFSDYLFMYKVFTSDNFSQNSHDTTICNFDSSGISSNITLKNKIEKWKVQITIHNSIFAFLRLKIGTYLRLALKLILKH